MGKRQENWVKNEKWLSMKWKMKKNRIIEGWKIIEIGWKMKNSKNWMKIKKNNLKLCGKK